MKTMSFFDPFADMTRLRQQIGRLLDENGSPSRVPEDDRVWRPAADLFEDDDAFTIQLDLPGLDREKLDVQLTGEELTVRGERRWVAPQSGACLHSERRYGQFQRVFRVGVPVQHDAVGAEFRDGVLAIRLPKAETVKPRKVEVKTFEG